MACSRISNISSICGSVMTSGGENTHMFSSGPHDQPQLLAPLVDALTELPVERQPVAFPRQAPLHAADETQPPRVADDG